MKLVIDIDENVYHRFVSGFANEDDSILIENLFKNGKPYEERPQGEWIIYGRQGGIPITDKCSNCGFEMKWYKNKYNFCPNCGAKMEGGTE